ncbi:MAG: hypothetical protein M1834_000369 [Cirrosporium novae-zelandiae]|nr:MAG: hypothetical protein M1834_000369 [Cirrosporium novae-zelandiae]
MASNTITLKSAIEKRRSIYALAAESTIPDSKIQEIVTHAILFYEDDEIVREFSDKFKTYASRFPGWSEQTNGMHQYAIWTALESEGLGVNLQHYNPLIDVRLQTEWDIPESWALKAQMVFGKLTGTLDEKTFKPIEERVIMHGK